MNTSEVVHVFDESEEAFDLATGWEHVYWRSCLNAEFQRSPVLRQTTGISQHQTISRFEALDSEIFDLTARYLAADLAKKRGPAGASKGKRVRELTETALIRHVMKQQRSTVSVRDFIHRAGDAAVALKPCFMMSPASVARYLPRGKSMFDIVIMDEASQIKAEEAIGSLARGKQAVIVGDTKQLPPTRFFERIGISDPEDENYEDVAVESVLEQALSRFESRTLQWHYRSEHQDLIRFSNRYFYDDQLVVFPAATDAAAVDMGVQFNHLPDAYYQSASSGKTGGLNLAQAAAVAKAAVRAMETRPDWSLGVVAVNKVQSEQIDDEIHVLLGHSPRARKYVNDRENTLEPFFVKNLENVQGDERDHIIISTVYGATGPDEPTRQSFGPIGGEHGGRRLNVLFSRAKKRVDVFSTMSASDIKVTDSSREGTRAMSAYLGYAETGLLGGPNEQYRESPNSDFEKSLARALTQAGFDVHYQVGAAKYSIDLGIRHPDYSHGYIAGVECDGATYHSAKSARDRELLRRQQLERLGWNIYRIWSTDWFTDPEGEMGRLIAYLTAQIKIANDKFSRTRELSIDDSTQKDGRLPDHTELSTDTETSGEPEDDVSIVHHLAPEPVRPANEEPTPEYAVDDDQGDDESLVLIDANADWSAVRGELDEYLDATENIESLPEMTSPSEEEDFNLGLMIEAVIDIEGPVHSSEIVERIRGAYGMGGLKGSPRGKILMLLQASSDDLVKRSGNFYDLHDRQPWGETRVPRTAGDRRIDHIDRSELLAACHVIAAEQRLADTKDLVKATSQALGYKRATKDVQLRLDNVAKECLEQRKSFAAKTNLQNNPSPLISENPLVGMGYDPLLDPAGRWMFMLNYALPALTRDGAINSLERLVEHFESANNTSHTLKNAFQIDLDQLRRYSGYR